MFFLRQGRQRRRGYDRPYRRGVYPNTVLTIKPRTRVHRLLRQTFPFKARTQHREHGFRWLILDCLPNETSDRPVVLLPPTPGAYLPHLSQVPPPLGQKVFPHSQLGEALSSKPLQYLGHTLSSVPTTSYKVTYFCFPIRTCSSYRTASSF